MYRFASKTHPVFCLFTSSNTHSLIHSLTFVYFCTKSKILTSYIKTKQSICRIRCYSTSSAQCISTNQSTKRKSPFTLQKQRSLYFAADERRCKIRTCSMSSQTDQFSVEEIDSIVITTPTTSPIDDVFVETSSGRICGRLE